MLAYLHRKEGDDINSRYWHRRAGTTFPADLTLEGEWQLLVTHLTEEWCAKYQCIEISTQLAINTRRVSCGKAAIAHLQKKDLSHLCGWVKQYV